MPPGKKKLRGAPYFSFGKKKSRQKKTQSASRGSCFSRCSKKWRGAPCFSFQEKEKQAKENPVRFAGLLFQQMLKEAARSALLFFWEKEKQAKEKPVRFAGLLFQQVLKEETRSALLFFSGKRKVGKRKPSSLRGAPDVAAAKRKDAERVAFSLAHLSLSQEKGGRGACCILFEQAVKKEYGEAAKSDCFSVPA